MPALQHQQGEGMATQRTVSLLICAVSTAAIVWLAPRSSAARRRAQPALVARAQTSGAPLPTPAPAVARLVPGTSAPPPRTARRPSLPTGVTLLPPSHASAARLLPSCTYGESGDYPEAWYPPRELLRLKRKGPRNKHHVLRGDFTKMDLVRHRALRTPRAHLHGVGTPHQFIDQLFKGRRGFFIESGAHDGCRESHTIWLERWRGWEGLLVEPNPGLNRRLRSLRRAAYTVECCVATEPQPHEVEFRLHGSLSGISTYISDEKVNAIRRRTTPEGEDVDSGRTVKRTCVPMRSLLANCGRELADLWVLDTEGAEVAILKAAVASGGVPAKVVYVEHANNEEQRKGIYDVLHGAGWYRFLMDPLDDWYVSPDHCKEFDKCFEMSH
eukprot:TRINITY_DN14626_c0_g1_i1.p1 TRINITY_DN14626_c0_g1~~TRINITY_DN14626_c0_g1_i1.p1  ORF type:complete len:385 (+),score=78.68 TRINITY_DN14626_c0_g1_i1:48-1202(+)